MYWGVTMSGLHFQEPLVVKEMAYRLLVPMQPEVPWIDVQVPIKPDAHIKRDDAVAVRNVQVWLLLAAGLSDKVVSHLFSLSISRCRGIAASCKEKFMKRESDLYRRTAGAQDVPLIELRSRQDQMMVAERLLNNSMTQYVVSNYCISLARDAFYVALADTEGKMCECSLCTLLNKRRTNASRTYSANYPHLSWAYWIQRAEMELA